MFQPPPPPPPPYIYLSDLIPKMKMKGPIHQNDFMGMETK